jgi:hypothetical protein
MGGKEDLVSVILFQKTVLSLITYQMKSPCIRNFNQRLLWNDFSSRNSSNFNFVRLLRMKQRSFSKLLDWIYDELEVDNSMAALRGGAIIPELRLFITLRYLAGGSYLYIIF